MSARNVSVILVLIPLATVCAAWADAGDSRVRIGLQLIEPMGDLDRHETETLIDTTFSIADSFEVDSTIGSAFSFEYMVTDSLGVEGSLGHANFDIDLDFVESETDNDSGQIVSEDSGSLRVAEVRMMPVIAGLNFHFQRGSLDYYFGPQLGVVFFGDIENVDPMLPDTKTDDDIVYGAIAGIDVSFGDHGWTFSATVRYLEMEITEKLPNAFGPPPFLPKSQDPAGPKRRPVVRGDDELDIDPVIIQVGVGVRF